jgi:hypothetical protein
MYYYYLNNNKFIIYIKGSMSIFIIYIGIIGAQFHFDCTNFRAPLIIKTINFNEIRKWPF